MTINERIKDFRKNVLHMNQRQFAADLGMAQTGISTMEQDGSTITERVIKSMCLAYNLNEDWLRNGTEPMYIQPSSFSLDKFVKDHGGTDLELETMKAYFELDPDIRKMLVQHFKERLTAARDEPVEQTMSAKREEAEEIYIKSRSGNVQKTAQSVLNTTKDIETKNDNFASNQ